MYYSWKPYVSVAKRRANSARELAKARAKGEPVSPVVIQGRTIASTFWGRAWCENLERYSDYANRLPRGRTYVRNGSVVDLQMGEGTVAARVAGSSLYRVAIKIKPVPEAQWRALRNECAGGFDSMVELLQGRFSKAVMERLCRPEQGLFPSPREITFECSCPDWAGMCKHVAATLYGVGARLDDKPELLFRLRRVDEHELILAASRRTTLGKRVPGGERQLDAKLAAELFGVEMAGPSVRTSRQAAASKPGRAVKPRKAVAGKRDAAVQPRKAVAGKRDDAVKPRKAVAGEPAKVVPARKAAKPSSRRK